MRQGLTNTRRPFTGAAIILLAGRDPQVVGAKLLLWEVWPSDFIFGSISIDIKDGGVSECWRKNRNGENLPVKKERALGFVLARKGSAMQPRERVVLLSIAHLATRKQWQKPTYSWYW